MSRPSNKKAAKRIRKRLAKEGFAKVGWTSHRGVTLEEHYFNKDHIKVTIDYRHVTEK